MEINCSQRNGICVNEVLIHGIGDNINNFVDELSKSPETNYQFKNESPNTNSWLTIMTEMSLLDFLKKLETLSQQHKVNLENVFYNSEADYAGTAYIYHGETKMEIDTYYKGLYYNHPARFWEEIDNLLIMMSESGGDWEEIETVINFCQYEDYNFIKDKFIAYYKQP